MLKESQPTLESQAILELQNICMFFSGIKAINDVSFSIREKEIFALIGPNGAGKTTMFNCITGMYTPTSGNILFRPDEKSQIKINSNKKPHQITHLGIARTFQNIRLFNEMTVLENILVGAQSCDNHSVWQAFTHGKKYQERHKAYVQQSIELIHLVGLEEFANNTASSLAYGDQRKLEIARALATKPRLLLLDEPAAGMNPQETIELIELIRRIRTELDISILLIEHDMHLVMNLSERICVVDYGKKIAEGSPEQIRTNPDVIRAYLGDE